MKIAYIRTSTFDQNPNLQKDELKKAGCEKIFEDKISGSLAKAQRPGLKAAIEYCRKGDVLVVWRLDRLGRSLKDLIEIINELNHKGINFESLTEKIDTTSANGMLLFHIFAAVAQFEKELIRERTNAGLKSARARGKKGGRPLMATKEKIRMAKQLHADPKNEIKDIIKTLGVSRALLYKMLRM